MGYKHLPASCEGISHQSIPVLVDKYHDSLEAAGGELPGGVGSALEECLQLGGSHPLIGVRPGGLGLVSFGRREMTTKVCALVIIWYGVLLRSCFSFSVFFRL